MDRIMTRKNYSEEPDYDAWMDELGISMEDRVPQLSAPAMTDPVPPSGDVDLSIAPEDEDFIADLIREGTEEPEFPSLELDDLEIDDQEIEGLDLTGVDDDDGFDNVVQVLSRTGLGLTEISEGLGLGVEETLQYLQESSPEELEQMMRDVFSVRNPEETMRQNEAVLGFGADRLAREYGVSLQQAEEIIRESSEEDLLNLRSEMGLLEGEELPPEFDIDADISEHVKKRAEREDIPDFDPEKFRKRMTKALKQNWRDVPSGEEEEEWGAVFRDSQPLTPDKFRVYDDTNMRRVKNLYMVGTNEAEGGALIERIGVDNVVKDVAVTRTNLFEILDQLGAKRPEDVLNGHIAEVSFNVNGGYDAEELDEVEGLDKNEVRARVMTAAKHAMMEILSGIPDGTILQNTPNNADGKGKIRAKLYERAGFGKYDGQKMYALKYDGKLHQIQPDKPREIGGVGDMEDDFFESLIQYVEGDTSKKKESDDTTSSKPVEINDDMLSDPDIWMEYFGLTGGGSEE